jgi:hypothetical protein
MTTKTLKTIYMPGVQNSRRTNSSNTSLQKKKCVKQSPNYGIAIHFSEKHQTVHQIRNSERDFAVLLDWSEDVLSYSSNVKLSTKANGKVSSHTFSFFVVYKDKQILVDVASCHSLRNTDQRTRKNIERIANNNDFDYEFVTSESIKGSFLRNVMHIRTALSKPSPETEFKEFCSHAPDQQLNIVDAQDKLRAQGKNPDLIRQFVAHGLVKADLHQPWQDIEIVWEAA